MAEISPFLSKIKESFRLVKVDVNALWFANENVNKRFDVLQHRVQELESQVLIVKGSRPKSSRFVASKLSNKVHEDRCVFARHIEPENLVVFPSSQDALGKGLEKCLCLA